ncbi:RidA family protein [Pelomonas sp. P7]|uniref:RidA family protein n=1 Tax=Pelomonas caseinilytica TaxID=2906763 RepID=A0ABS8XN22_9BURK|nr:RidA family protein [Pelomonas sp. P7]MCE4540029.1 RidA family protein [Pelomonas sp. P7]
MLLTPSLAPTVAALLAGLALLPLAHAADPAPVLRHRPPGSTFPIASAVEVPAGRALVLLSGVVPPVVDDKAERGSLAAYGDTRTQTQGVLKAIERQLQAQGLGLGDVVKMQVFLVGDPAKAGRMDFDGFMAAYREFFGTAAQPNLPARSVMQVAGLVVPGWLVEIEVMAVR